jgi:hypothetical protein
VRSTFENIDREHIFLGGLNVLILMPPGFSNSCNSEETILGSIKSKSRHIEIPFGSSIIVKFMLVSQQTRSHKDETLEVVRVGSSVVLSHDTSEGVTCK